MTFTETKERLKEILLQCGVRDVLYSKSRVPDVFPACLLSLSRRVGNTRMTQGFAGYKFTFDVVLVCEDESDCDIVSLVEAIDLALQDGVYTEIESVEFYDSLLSTKEIQVAQFEVTL